MSASFFTCENSGYAVAGICIAMTVTATFIPGFLTSMVTLAPAHSGLITSITRIASTAGGVLGPFIIGAIIREGPQHEWRLVFAIMSATLIVAGFTYLLFGSGRVVQDMK